jgi:hypothetical protein
MPLQAVQLSLIYINTPYRRRESKRVSNSAFTHPIHTLFIFHIVSSHLLCYTLVQRQV